MNTDGVFKIILSLNETRKIPVMVRTSKSDTKFSSNNIEETLKGLGLEQVSLDEILPKYKKITTVGGECSICQQLYKEKEYERTLKCNHRYHKKCIDKWLKNNPSCPICRHDLL